MAVRQRLAAVVAAAVLAGGLSGCGGADGPAPGGSPTGSGAPTPTPSSASPTWPAKPTDRSPHGMLLSAQLAMQTARRAKVSYRLGSDAGSGPLFWQPKTALQVRRSTPASAEQLIVVDTVAYEGGDAATAARLGGRHWERFAGAPGPDGHREIPYAGLIDLLNPVVALAAATADGTTAQYVGEEKFEDSTVEHYRVSTDAARYAAAQTQLSQARREGLRTALAPGGSASLTLDLWLNDKDQLVRLQRTGAGDSGRLDDSVLYTEPGGPLSAQAPAESDTVDTGTRSTPPTAR
ncbi:hypothetical protein [Kitasatospora purpeofusca]|uniref:hypothetical protein n=1 Tax=Kitasatospora purpeofusca TaxID=67352 RepID=UPI002A5AEE20|nr:hypothetical protein [Kitasatospora purpeofusca]MDY0815376.1 hypothetical protein [Kitasatospora purpeofusca]